jgi:hypothetical protein
VYWSRHFHQLLDRVLRPARIGVYAGTPLELQSPVI